MVCDDVTVDGKEERKECLELRREAVDSNLSFLIYILVTVTALSTKKRS
jgi:hypothetical protein